MFGSSHHKTSNTRNEQRRNVKSAPTETTSRDLTAAREDYHRSSDVTGVRISDGAHVLSPLSPSVICDSVPIDERSAIKYSSGIYYHQSTSHATSRLLQGKSSGCGDAPIGDVSVPGITSMPSHVSQVTSKQNLTKRGRFGLAVDAVRGVLGVSSVSEVKQTERGHGIVFQSHRINSSKCGPMNKHAAATREQSNISTSQQNKELYIEFVTPPSVSPPSCSSPPPLPSPCDILSSLPQPAKRPMKMPMTMSTFKSNNEPNMRPTGGESRSHIDSNFMWTKNPVAAIYYEDQEVPISPPQSPLYMLYDTSPEHMYDSIPDDSSLDGMQDYCTSPTLPKRQMCLSPTLYTNNIRSTSRPSCGIRMAEMRAATKRLQSPPLEGDIPGQDDVAVVPTASPLTSPHDVHKEHSQHQQLTEQHAQSQYVSARQHTQTAYTHKPSRCIAEGKTEKKQLAMYNKTQSKIRTTRTSVSSKNSFHKDNSPHHLPPDESVLQEKLTSQRHKKDLIRGTETKSIRPQSIYPPKNIASSGNKVSSKTRAKNEHSVTKNDSVSSLSNLVQQQNFMEEKLEVGKKNNTNVPQRSLRQPSKAVPPCSSPIKHIKDAKNKLIHRERNRSEHFRSTENEKVSHEKHKYYHPHVQEHSMDSFKMSNTNIIETSKEGAPLVMKDSFMSISFSSCSPQSSDSEHSGSCTSLNSSMVMDSSIESSDLERSCLKTTDQMLTDMASLDMFDVHVTSNDIHKSIPLHPVKSLLKQPAYPLRKEKREVTPLSQLKKYTSSKSYERSTSQSKSPEPRRNSSNPSSKRMPKQSYKYDIIPSTSRSYMKEKLSTNETHEKCNTYNHESKGIKKCNSVPVDKKIGMNISRTISYQESSHKQCNSKGDTGIRSPNRIRPTNSKIYTAKIVPRSSDGKQSASKIALVSSGSNLSDHHINQRRSLEPPKAAPNAAIKPRRHYSDSADTYQRIHSNIDNVSSTPTTPSTVSESPLSSESCSSPLSPFHSDSSNGGGHGGGGRGGCTTHKPSSVSQKRTSNRSKSVSSNKSKHSNCNKEGGYKRTIAAPISTFVNKLDKYEYEKSKMVRPKPKSGLKPPTTITMPKIDGTIIPIKYENLMKCDRREDMSYLQDSSVTKRKEGVSLEEAMDYENEKYSNHTNQFNVPVLINVHNDNTGKDSDHNLSATNLCGAGTHLPSDSTTANTPSVHMKSSVNETHTLCKSMAELTTDDPCLTVDFTRSLDEDPVFDLTEDSTYKIIDNKSSDDCDDIQDDGHYLINDENENNNAIIPYEIEALLNCAELTDPVSKRHAVYQPDLEDPFQQILDGAEKILNLIKDQELEEVNMSANDTLDDSDDKPDFFIDTVDSYEQLCEKSLDVIPSSPEISIDFLNDTTSSNDNNEPERIVHTDGGSISDGGNMYGLRSSSTHTLPQRCFNKCLSQYTNTFCDDHCSLKRVDAKSSLNMQENTLLRDYKNSSSSIVMDTAISESSLHTCVREQTYSNTKQHITDGLLLASPNLTEGHLLTDDGESSEAESFVCNFNLNSSRNNLVLCLDMTMSTNSLGEPNQSFYPSDCGHDTKSTTPDCGTLEHNTSSEYFSTSSTSPLPLISSPLFVQNSSETCLAFQHLKNKFSTSSGRSREIEDEADTDTLKQSESCLTLCESRSESDSSGFTSLRDEGSIVSEDRVSTSSSSMSLCSSATCSSTSSQLSTSHSGGTRSWLRPPSVGLGRGLKPPTPNGRFTNPRRRELKETKSDPPALKRILTPVDEMGMAMAVQKGDEGYYTMSMQGHADKVSIKIALS